MMINMDLNKPTGKKMHEDMLRAKGLLPQQPVINLRPAQIMLLEHLKAVMKARGK